MPVLKDKIGATIIALGEGDILDEDGAHTVFRGPHMTFQAWIAITLLACLIVFAAESIGFMIDGFAARH